MNRYKNLFFPLLKRRIKYEGKGDGKRSTYSDYHDEIQEDCQHRCVYCDITVQEHGYEGMQLDHFRPEIRFPRLQNDPNNLVLACPKCNRLKWHNWPCEIDENKPSYSGDVGFIDPFGEDRWSFFSVDEDGKLVPIQHPATYIMNLLNLNRKARVQVRRKRIFISRIQALMQDHDVNIKKAIESFSKGDLTLDDVDQEIEQGKKLYALLSVIIS